MIELAILAAKASEKEKKLSYIITKDGKILKFHIYQHFCFGNNNWIAASCTDEQTGNGFAIGLNNIMVKIYEK